ncbi:MAG: methyltransferase domain-containing protein [Candidatus Taylorbacteria bacterium]|nr:methyltransferase domain-containing protein [Candidatus Taylorbacteria bacterium]
MEKPIKKPKTDPTSWGSVAKWYDETVESKGSYQQDLILPNLLRLMDIKKGEKVLDLACGQGLFARAFQAAGAKVVAADISKELVAIAQKKSEDIAYHVAPAHALPFLKDRSMDKVAIVLALQNIENFRETIAECSRVLAKNGKLYVVLNHPAFRIPKASSWEFDEKKNAQYRRIDRYLSELRTDIAMHPGSAPQEHTVSFHRPLQLYFKAFAKANLAVLRLEEWISGKKSQDGPRGIAEDFARKEIPLFLTIEAQKLSRTH